ncbi:MAG: AmmeMemoRadiSam system protein B [Caldisericaceae bacterium]
MKIREPAVEGTFYPSDREELRLMLRHYIENASLVEMQNLKGLVAPHAGYVYSGAIAGASYRQLINLDLAKLYKVIILGPSHYEYFNGASVGIFDAYKTPLGLANVSKIASLLIKEDNFHFLLDAHIEEHSIEVQIPFLQYVLPHFEIVPILLGEVSYTQVADVLKKYIDETTIVIASSDLSHYYPYEKATKIDKHCTSGIEKLSFAEFNKCEACGKTGIQTLLKLSLDLGWKSKVIMYANSGDTAGPKDRVVGYGSYAFYKE